MPRINDTILWWLSCSKFTIKVESCDTAEPIILYAAPIARRFIGQRLTNLKSWMRTLGGFREYEL